MRSILTYGDDMIDDWVCKMKKYIYLFMLFLWMVLIFSFSAKNAEASSNDSHRISIWLGKMVIQDFEEMSPEKQEEFIEFIELPIRKGAHASEYAVLAMLSFLTIASWKDDIEYKKQVFYKIDRKKQISVKKMLIISWSIATIYACTDEFHQLFVPGRSGQVMDVCIDSMGAAIGLIIMMMVLRIWKKKIKRRRIS